MYVLPYLKIFKQALDLTKTNKFLWIFGLFLVWGGLISNIAAGLTRPEYREQRSLVADWLKNNSDNTLLFFGLITLVLILLVLYFRAKSGIIISIKAILDKQKTGFVKSFRVSRFFYSRVLGIHLISGLIIFFSGALLAGPVFYLSSEGLDFRAGVLSLFALLIFAPISIVLSFINSLGSIFVVFHDFRIEEGFKQGLRLSLKFWPTLLIFIIYLSLISILIFLISVILAGTVVSAFVILADLFYDNGGFVDAFVNGVGYATALVLFLTIQSAVISFHHIAWVLAFRELVRPVKMEEEAVVVPEIAS